VTCRLHAYAQHAVLGKVGIVVETRDLQPAEQEDDTTLQRHRIRVALAAEPRDEHALDTRDGLCRGIDPAEIDRLRKAEIVRVKQTSAAVRQQPAAQQLDDGAPDICANTIGTTPGAPSSNC